MQHKYEAFCKQTMDMIRRNFKVAEVGSELAEKLENVGRNGNPIGINLRHPKVATKTINLITKTPSLNTATSAASSNDIDERITGRDYGKSPVE